MPITGRSTGRSHTALVVWMACTVWLATWAKDSPVMRHWQSSCRATASARRIIKRRITRVK